MDRTKYRKEKNVGGCTRFGISAEIHISTGNWPKTNSQTTAEKFVDLKSLNGSNKKKKTARLSVVKRTGNNFLRVSLVWFWVSKLFRYIGAPFFNKYFTYNS